MPRKVFVAGEILTAADVNEYLSDQVIMTFAGTAARGSAIGTAVEGMFTYLEDSDSLEYWNGSSWEEFSAGAPIGTATPAEGSYLTYSTAVSAYEPSVGGTPSYRYVDTVYYTSNNTFTKASYPWLRAIRVNVQGAGGGGGGAATTSASQAASGSGGSGGGYAQSFITDIAGLASSVTITVGAGGSGGAAGANNGSNGGNSSFGTVVVGNGGVGGFGRLAVTNTIGQFHQFGRTGGSGTGDLVIQGGDSPLSSYFGFGFGYPGPAGSSFLSGQFIQGAAAGGGIDGSTGRSYGGGGSGGANGTSQATARAGGTGADGIVTVELYA